MPPRKPPTTHRWLALAVIIFTLILFLGGSQRQPVENQDSEVDSEVTGFPTFNLGPAGFRLLSTWQLCNMDKDRRWQWMTSGDDACVQVFRDPIRLELVAYAPGVDIIFDLGDPKADTDTLAKIGRHLKLASSAVAELKSKFRIGPDFLRNSENICVDLPRFNATIAEIIPWHDLFAEWHQLFRVAMLSSYSHNSVLFPGYETELQSVEALIQHGSDTVMRITKLRLDPIFEQKVIEYNQQGCGASPSK
ncbi:hypothetical protein GGR50DRAFT_695361 [Xylaria sp. CBS 124048]|nr:hypothetical protein GGR50DRAFT_695361 [Xylaria sp. CBS 124048]